MDEFYATKIDAGNNFIVIQKKGKNISRTV